MSIQHKRSKMPMTPGLPPQSRNIPTLIIVLPLATALLAGCLGGPQEDEGAEGAILFEPGAGPGSSEPLIPLTGEPKEDAAAILAACEQEDDLIECANKHLMGVLGAEGSMYAFDVLEAMTALDRDVKRMDHPMAHVLGRHALYVYGTIGETLITCSHKVFQGCIHGALQEYFERVELDDADLDAVCPPGASAFERYACMHGLGHGLVLATGYDLPHSLDLCASLGEHTDRVNCYGGAFMENVVAHNDHIRAGGTFAGHGRDPQTEGSGDGHGHHGDEHHGHDHGGHHAHGGDSVPDFWVDPEDPYFPCNALDGEYEPYCWRMQTSLIHFLNGGDFEATAAICAELDGSSKTRCYSSMGRDASSWAQRDPQGVAQRCGFIHDGTYRYQCIQGAVAELVTNYADPYQGLPYCADYPESDRGLCYRALGLSARNHLEQDELDGLCSEVKEPYQGECRSGAGI